MNRNQHIIMQGILSQQRISVKDDAFITTWNIPTDNFTLTFPTEALSGYSFDYNIDWGDGSPAENRTAAAAPTHTYQAAGTYKVRARGVIPKWVINNKEMKDYLLMVDSWGSVGFKNFYRMFKGATNLEGIYGDVVLEGDCFEFLREATVFSTAVNHWDVSNVTNMKYMFYGATAFNQDISSWDVSNVTNMNSMFYSATSFNGDISNWNVSKVASMSSMFNGATAFNQDISGWDVSKVIYMGSMFNGANSFNQDISGWDVSKVIYMNSMFYSATAFNQDLSGWCVEKIPTKPSSFDVRTTAWVKAGRQPIWGAPCL